MNNIHNLLLSRKPCSFQRTFNEKVSYMDPETNSLTSLTMRVPLLSVNHLTGQISGQMLQWDWRGTHTQFDLLGGVRKHADHIFGWINRNVPGVECVRRPMSDQNQLRTQRCHIQTNRHPGPSIVRRLADFRVQSGHVRFQHGQRKVRIQR